MKLSASITLLIIAVVCFAIGFVRPSLGGFDWKSGGWAFGAASLVV